MDCKTHFDIPHKVINLGNPKTAQLHTRTARHTLTSSINLDNPKTAQLCTCTTRCTLTSPINLISSSSNCFCIVLFSANKQTYCTHVACGSEWVTVSFYNAYFNIHWKGNKIKKNCTAWPPSRPWHLHQYTLGLKHVDWSRECYPPPPPPTHTHTHSFYNLYTFSF